MLRLKSEFKQTTLQAKDLKDGQLAVIIEEFHDYKGRIIQKYDEHIVAIGMPTGNGWYNGAEIVSLNVRILEDGELLTVSNNE